MTEVWKDIPNYEGLYEISNLKRVKSVSRTDPSNHQVKERILKTSFHGHYMHVGLYKDCVKTTCSVQQIYDYVFGDSKNIYPIPRQEIEESTHILATNFKTGKIQEFDSVDDASEQLQVPKRSINMALNHNARSSSGYFFQYLEVKK